MIIPHPQVVNNSNPGSQRPHAKFQPDWSYDYFLAGKTTFCECSYDKTTPTAMWLLTLTLLLRYHMSNCWPDWSSYKFLLIKTTSCGCGNNKPHPLQHPCLVNHAHLITEKPYAKFQTDLSSQQFSWGQTISCRCGCYKTTLMWLITFTQLLGDHMPNSA